MDQTRYLERYKQICDYELENTRRKGCDYAGTDDVFRNFELIEVLTAGRIMTPAGILVRLTDKMQRIANLLARPAQVADESILDTLVDLSSYSKILYLYLTRNWTELALTHPGDTKVTPSTVVDVTEPNPVLDAIMAKFQIGGMDALDSSDRQYLELMKNMAGV